MAVEVAVSVGVRVGEDVSVGVGVVVGVGVAVGTGLAVSARGGSIVEIGVFMGPEKAVLVVISDLAAGIWCTCGRKAPVVRWLQLDKKIKVERNKKIFNR